MKLPVSAAIIAYNESLVIERCIRSCSRFTEIIVVDSDSTDDTVEIAKMSGAKVFTHDFVNFSEQKNYALSLCSQKWIFSLDADEEITPELISEIEQVISSPLDVYYVPRKTLFINRWIIGCGWYPDYVARLFRKNSARFADTAVHEYLETSGKTGKLKNPLLHYSYPSLSAYFNKFDSYTTLAAQEMKRKNKSFSPFMLFYKPLFKFLKMYLFQKGFLDGIHGFIVCLLGAWYTLMKYIKFWEIVNAS